MEALFVGKLNVHTSGESFDCCITGMDLISSHEIALADYYNNSVKIFNISTNTITSTQKLPAAPWDVTRIDSETAATTLPKKGQIMFVSTKIGKSKRGSLEVRKDCWGIDHKNNVIVVSFSNPSAVQVLDIKGNILHEFNIQGIFNCQCYISLSIDNSSTYVSDNQNHVVHQLTTDGQEMVAMHCGDLVSPAGLTVMRNGTVVVCGIGNSDRVSTILPGTRELVPLPVDDMHKPCCVTISEEENKIYISEDVSSVDRHYIKVYDLKY